MVINLSTTQLVRYLVGFVFVISALMKILGEGMSTYFANLGFGSPTTIMYLVAAVELICGLLIWFNRYVKISTIPLLVIIIGSLIFTKLPMLHTGIISTLFHARLDLVMLGLLFLLYQQYDGKLFKR